MSINAEGLVKEGEGLKELLDDTLQRRDYELLSALRQDFRVLGVLSRPWKGAKTLC